MSPTATHPTLDEMKVGIPATSTATKLVLAVKPGPVVAFPEDAVLSGYGQNDDQPVVVVRNLTDGEEGIGTWQGADATSGVVIMNGVQEELAERLLDMAESGEPLSAIIATAEKASQVDNYTTDYAFVDEHLTSVGRMLGRYTGRVARLARDTAQIGQRNGVFYVVPPSGEDSRVIQPEILTRDYIKVDGSPINLEDVPEV